MADKPHFSRADYQVEACKTRYQGFFRLVEYRLRHRLFGGGWSGSIRRELFVRGATVAVLPYDPRTDCLVMQEQFRVGALADPAGPWQVEIVAGIVEAGQCAATAARRELEEETGIADAELVPVCDYWVSAGGTDEHLTLFCALVDSEGAGGIHGLAGEHEDIRTFVVPRTEAMAALAAGSYRNAPLIIALQWLALHHDRLAAGASD